RTDSFLKDSEIATLDFREYDGLRVIQGSAYIGIVRGSRIPTSATMYRRNAAIEAGLHDPVMKQCNDRDFLLRISRLSAFGYFPKGLSVHQRHETNLTHPRHRIVNRGYKLKVLNKMLQDRDRLRLTDAELART